jgi:methyl-accepting chemotaxis protein
MLGSGIQRKLIISFLLIGAAPMVIMGFLSYSKSSRVLIDQTNDQMRNLTTKGIEQLESFLTIYNMQMEGLYFPFKSSIDYMEVGMKIEDGTKEMTLKILTEYLKKYPAIRRVRLLDHEGNEKFTTLKDKTDLEKESGSPWFQKVLGSREVCLSKMSLSEETKEPILIMAKAVYGQLNRDKPVAVISVELWGKQVTASLENVKFGNDSYAYILNQEGYVIAYPDKKKLFQLNLGSTDFGKEILTKKNGTIEYAWEGKSRVASFQEYPLMHWTIVTSALKGDILTSIKEMRNQFIIVGIVIAGIALITAILMSWRISRPIQWVAEGLTQGAEQVSSASGQISQASQQVAQGSGEQASSIEETSSSLEEIASIAKQNSDNAQHAKAVMNEADQIIKKVQYHMGQMGQAIAEITALSEETSKIIKTIDEIAFQTNLLALNAAVEAARAGEAGAGFSVVANEVRNLAMKASEAAKNTGQLIENTMKAVKKGNELTQSTQDAFKENIKIALEHTRLIEEIAAASQEQAQGIEQVASAVVQMNQVTQANAANAEESASAGEELNAQAEQVNSMIQELLAIVGGSNGAHHGGSRVAHKARQVVGKLHHTAAGLLHHGPEESRVQVTAPPLKQKQSRPKKVTEGKRTAHKDPEELIPFHEDKEKDEQVLRKF